MQAQQKRQNFNTTPEQEAELVALRDILHAPSAKDAVLRAVRIVGLLAQEMRNGHAVYIKSDSGEMTRLLIPELESVRADSWKYLVERPHAWRSQRYVKGRKLLASTVWSDMRANNMSAEEAAENWNLPREAIEEIIRYCEINQELLLLESDEEAKRLTIFEDAEHAPAPSR